ncbi:kinase-like protein [Rhizophagus irregularis]|uniref:Kinase-like protein n=1 Tax=Rhizophagus irregularis TaxID=588596 RepID=A0A2I1HCY0_9GLOM|nr:kinase-like protein [Rhizophagus irregularis]
MNGLGTVGNFCGEQFIASRFLKSEYEASKSNPSKRLVYGITRNPVTRCPDCHKEWMSLRWCRGCNPKHFESERHKWTSGNSDIDDFILETQITAELSDQALEWIPETHLTEFKLIGKGGFGKEGRICKWDSIANKWKRGESMWVALKSVEKGEEGVKEFLEEDRLWSLTIDLRSLHRSGLVHRDLHSGNVLFGNNRRNFVADLGLACKDGQNITGDIKGVLPYVAPEILLRQLHTKASDIYSFGIIMWEVTSSQPPFYETDETAYDFNLALSICDGKRPQVIKGTPACYVELMKKCWDPDPSKRPTAQEMAEIFNKWTQIFSKDELNEEEKSIKDQFVSSDLERQKSSRPTRIFRELSTRPLTSRLLPTVSLSNQDLRKLISYFNAHIFHRQSLFYFHCNISYDTEVNLSYNVFIQHAEYQTTQYDLKITNDLPGTYNNTS